MTYQASKVPAVAWIAVLATIASLGLGAELRAQAGPSPYRLVDDWAKLPNGRPMGAVGKVTMDPDGEHLWAVIRCDARGFDVTPSRFGNECVDSDLDPIIKFDMDGNVVESFGGGLFIWPHGMDVGPDGSVWVTDAAGSNAIPAGDSRGHLVYKFSQTGDVLVRLGTPGRAGSGRDGFTSPSDVVVAPNGDVFIADGHNNDGNNRVVKFTGDGDFIMSWGQTGYAPGEFRALHAIDMDSRGRVFVGDRSNNRIQIFDQEGEHLATWTQFGRPSGIAFDGQGRIYVADSESDNVQNPGWEMGIRIGDAETGWVTEFILYGWGDPHVVRGNGAEFVAVDRQGNIYGGEPIPRNLQKYVRVR
jgi:DNA-binding beta-propeller fold protein YncE